MTKKIRTQKVVLVSFLVDLLDVATNLVVAVLTGSATVYSEMAQGVADSIGSVFLVIGEKRSRRAPDKNHPLGYAREAFFWSLISAIVMLIIGGGLSFVRGMQQLLNPEPIRSPILAIGVITLAVITNGYAVSLSARKLKNEIGGIGEIFKNYSYPLVKGAFLRDVVGTSTSVLGLIALLLHDLSGLLIFDAIGALISALFMSLGSMVLINQARGLIAGQTLPENKLRQLNDAILGNPNVEGVNQLVAIYAGPKEILIEADLDLSEDLNTSGVERVLDSIEERIRREIPHVRRVRVLLNSPKPAFKASGV